MDAKRIVLLAGEYDSATLVYHSINDRTPLVRMVQEAPVAKKEFLRKRIKKLGWITVGGQVLFQALIAKPMGVLAKGRIGDILEEYGLKATAVPQDAVTHVSSVNSDECLRVLQELRPDLVVVHGTRIISKKILQGVPCPFLNIHAGITPRYRGSHGAYWALANGDAEHCGVTVHFVDPGIDTGNILFQKVIAVTKKDNFITYPYLQLGEGLRLLEKAIDGYFDGTLQPVRNPLNSALWHHPTLWGYLRTRLSRGVR
jgi:folate-dependent phosphoribosylglycinamide formyltransferase PurN